MIVIKLNRDMVLEFTMSLSMLCKANMDIKDTCVLFDDNFVLLPGSNGIKTCVFNLTEGNITVGETKFPSIDNFVTNIVLTDHDTYAGMACNMIHNAMEQWCGLTPFRGDAVCKDLSRQVTSEIQHLGLSMKLSEDGIFVYKNNLKITYETFMRNLCKWE